MNWLLLIIAIVSETIATSTLKASDGFRNFVPSIISVVGYISAFFFLSLVLKTIPVAMAYAIWSGIGIVLIALVGWFYYKQTPDIPAIIGIIFIVTGVIIINIFSRNINH